MSLDTTTVQWLALVGALTGLVALVLAAVALLRVRRLHASYALLQSEDGAESFMDAMARKTQEVAALHPDLVVVGGRGLQRNMAAPVDQRASAWSSGVTATIRALAPLTRRLVVLGDVPALGVDPIGCLTDTHATMATCTTAVDPRTTEANELTANAASLAGVDYIGLGDLACVDGRCPVVAGGLMVYANEDHLSRSWVAHVTPEFRRRLAVLPAGATGTPTGR